MNTATRERWGRFYCWRHLSTPAGDTLWVSRLSSCFWGRWGFFCFCGGYLNLIEFYIRAVEWGGVVVVVMMGLVLSILLIIFCWFEIKNHTVLKLLLDLFFVFVFVCLFVWFFFLVFVCCCMFLFFVLFILFYFFLRVCVCFFPFKYLLILCIYI